MMECRVPHPSTNNMSRIVDAISVSVVRRGSVPMIDIQIGPVRQPKKGTPKPLGVNTCPTVAVGYFCFKIAHAPDTCAAALDVPVPVPVVELPPGIATVTDTPGANSDRYGAETESVHIWLLLSERRFKGQALSLGGRGAQPTRRWKLQIECRNGMSPRWDWVEFDNQTVAQRF